MVHTIKKLGLSILLLGVSYTAAAENTMYALVGHGFGDSASNSVMSQSYMCPTTMGLSKIVAPEFGDYGNLLVTHLGQGQDIEALKNTVQKDIQGNPFVAIGHSRGGAALISYVGQHNPANLKALVVRGAPSSMPDVVGDIMGGFAGSGILGKIALKLGSKYPLRDLKPIDAIEKIENKDLPVVVMHQKYDEVVANYHGRKLYDKFKACGFKNVYWMETNDVPAHIPPTSWGRSYSPHNTSPSTETLIKLFSIYKKHGIVSDMSKYFKTTWGSDQDVVYWSDQQNAYTVYTKNDFEKDLKETLQPQNNLYKAPAMFRKGNIVVALVTAGALYGCYTLYKKCTTPKNLEDDEVFVDAAAC